MSARSGTPPSSARVALGQAHHAGPLVEPRAWLVERDMPVRPQAQHGEIERRLVEHGVVARALGREVGGAAVEPVERAQADAAQLVGEHGRPAARIAGAEAGELVERQHRGRSARELAEARVRPQRRVQPHRRTLAREQQSQRRPCPQPVGDQLRRELGDPFLVGEDERRRHGVHRGNGTADLCGPRTGALPRWQRLARDGHSEHVQSAELDETAACRARRQQALRRRRGARRRGLRRRRRRGRRPRRRQRRRQVDPDQGDRRRPARPTPASTGSTAAR